MSGYTCRLSRVRRRQRFDFDRNIIIYIILQFRVLFNDNTRVCFKISIYYYILCGVCKKKK